MGFFDTVSNGLSGYFKYKTNKKAAKRLSAGGRVADGHVRKAYDDSLGFLDMGLNESTKYLDPFIESGGKGRKLYYDALGVNGDDAQQIFYDGFNDDPGFQDAVDYSQNQVERSFANRGGVNSGRAMIALADNARKAKLGAYQNRLAHLKGVSDTGYSASRGAADLTYNTGANKARLSTGLGERLANNALAGAGAQAQFHANTGNIIGSTLSNLGYSIGHDQGTNSVNNTGTYYNPFPNTRDFSTATDRDGRQKQKPLYQFPQPFKALNDLNRYF